MGPLEGWRAWALRLMIVLALAGFITAAYGLTRARQQSIDSRRELCQAENKTRAGVRTMINLAFAPTIAKTTDPAKKKRLIEFQESLKEPLADLPCKRVVKP